MRTTRRTKWTTKCTGGGAGLLAALAMAASASTANAQLPAGSPMAGFPATPALPPPATAAAAWALEGGLATLPLPAVPLGGQLVFGGYSIANILNGGTSVVVANGGPIDSGNVIASP
jgi:hypothetical protein